MSDNTPPAMDPIPNFVASVLTALVLTNRAEDADVPVNALEYSLEAGAPTNALIHRETGVFRWMPVREQASSTNLITVKVSDNGKPSLSDKKSFTVLVKDYLEVFPGSVVLRAGERGSVPVRVYSSAGLSSLRCVLHFPKERLTDVSVETLLPELVSVSLDSPDTNCAVLTFTALPGRTLQGMRELVRLHFTAIPGQNSAFLPLRIGEINCERVADGLAPTSVSNAGRVVVIGSQSMLEGRLAAGGQRELILYGQPGASYGIESSTNATDPSAWMPWQQATLTNLFNVLPAGSNVVPSIFYRTKE